jgi:hypothetical protein
MVPGFGGRHISGPATLDMLATMAPRQPPRRNRKSPDPLEAYRRIRKPMPPPERVLPDKRRKVAEREAEREARQEEP